MLTFSEVEKLWVGVDRTLLSIGARGVTDKHANSLAELLRAHTLVKVKFNGSDADVGSAAEQLAQGGPAQLLQVKGKTALFATGGRLGGDGGAWRRAQRCANAHSGPRGAALHLRQPAGPPSRRHGADSGLHPPANTPTGEIASKKLLLSAASAKLEQHQKFQERKQLQREERQVRTA
jgi:RNA-binding protein YhbY